MGTSPDWVVEVRAKTIQALLRVGEGWRLVEDAWWTRVISPDGTIEISLNVFAREGRSIEQILDDIERVAVMNSEAPEFERQHEGGIWKLSIRDAGLEEVQLVKPWGDGEDVLRARVNGKASEFAALVMESAEYREWVEEVVVHEPVAAPEPAGLPDWFLRAEALELEGRLEEMEAAVLAGVQTLHCAIAIADLYRTRWIRLKESDPEAARAARQKAADWAWNYASYATSGGEGAALSLERDAFIRTLGPEPLE